MGFAFTDSYVEIGTDQRKLDQGLDQAKAKVNKFQSVMAGLSRAGMVAFGGLQAAKAIVVKAFADSEEASSALRTALRATGQEVDANYTKLDTLAENLQRSTTFSRDAIKAQMAYALNLGVTADQLADVTKAGIGLGTALFNGNLEEGVKAVSEAQEGNFRALQKLIPGLKDANTAQDKMNLVLKTARIGYEEAQAKGNTFYGGLKQLQNSSQELAATFGALLAPSVEKINAFLQVAVNRLQAMTPAQKQQVVRWFGIATAIAAVVAFGPQIVAFGTMAVSAFTGIGSAVVTLGGLLVGLVTSPMAIVVAGLAGIALGFVYLAGSGNTMVERLTSGFLNIIEFLDHMFGSWKGFTTGLVTLWDQTRFAFEDVWISIKKIAIEVWEWLKAGFPDVVYGWGGALAEWAVKAWGIMKQFANYVKKVWSEVVDYVANKLAEVKVKSDATDDVRAKYEGRKLTAADAHQLAGAENVRRSMNAVRKANQEADDKGLTGQARSDFVQQRSQELHGQKGQEALFKQYEQQYAGKKLDDGQLTDLIQKETQIRLDALRQQREANDRQRDQEYQENMKAIDEETHARVDAVKKWAAEGKAKTPLDHARERDAALKKNAEERARLEAERKKTIDADMAKLKSMPKLSDQAKALYDKIKSGAGLGDIMDQIKKIQAEADNLKNKKAAAAGAAGGVGNLKAQGNDNKKVQLTSLDDAFKKAAATAALGHAINDPKLKAQQDAVKLHQQANQILKRVEDAIKNLVPGIGQLLGWQ